MAEGAPAGDRRPSPPRPAADGVPLWRQGYDLVERTVAPPLEALVRSDGFARAVGAATHAQRVVQRQVARSTRRVLHLLNLPAATDVTHILNELGRLEKQVRELGHQLEEVTDDAHPARPGGADRTRPA